MPSVSPLAAAPEALVAGPLPLSETTVPCTAWPPPPPLVPLFAGFQKQSFGAWFVFLQKVQGSKFPLPA